MTTAVDTIAGLRTLHVQVGAEPSRVVVMLHGYQMRPEDLSPFAASLGVSAHYYVPAGRLNLPDGTHAWWSIDEERRAHALAVGPRDLADEHPPGTIAARADLERWLLAVTARHGTARAVIIGFSQGGMLTSEFLLRERGGIEAVALLSSSRIRFAEWDALSRDLTDFPVLVAHGRHDPDLAFHAGEALADFYRSRSAAVTWVPFEGGHEIPLVVWRALRKFLTALP